MVKTQIYLDSSQLACLKYSAAKEKVSYAQLIRDAVSDYLEKTETTKSNEFSWRKTAEASAINMGGNLASNIDKELYT